MVAIDNAPQTRPVTTQPPETTPALARRRHWWPPVLAVVAILIGLSVLSPAGPSPVGGFVRTATNCVYDIVLSGRSCLATQH